MATVTKTVTDIAGATANRSTWTYIINYENVTVTGDTFTVKLPSITAKYSANVYKDAISYLVQESCYIGETNVFSANKYREIMYLANNTFGALDNLTYMSPTQYASVDRTNQTATLTTSQWFDSTTRSIPLTFRAGSGYTLRLGSGHLMYPSDPDQRYFDRYTEYYTNASEALITITATIDAPPIATLGTPTYSTPQYAGLGTYSVDVINAEAQLGATISSIALKIGSQTEVKEYSASTVTNDTFSITPAVAGPFTPTVVITDSRGQTKEMSLQPIVVNQYNAPSMSFDVVRCDDNGILNVEGTYGLVTANISYTDAIAKLTQPTVSVNDEDGHTVLSNAVWYRTWDATNGVANVVNWTNYNPESPVTLYAVISATNSELSPNEAYTISVTPTDDKGGSAQAIIQTLPTAYFTIDFQAGGKEIAFGAPANDNLSQHPNGLFKCAMDVRFEGDISGISTSTPVADTIAEFDSTAHMNSTDMTPQETQDFVDGNLSGQEAITRNDLANILNEVLPAIRITVEDISDKITFGSAWSNYMRKAYLVGKKFVFFNLEGYAGTIMAGTQYTIATIASGYRPKDNLAFTGHATNANYLPQSTVNCYVWTSGDITVRCSNANGNYVFISGWYALA